MRQIQLNQLMLQPNISVGLSILTATPAAGVDGGASLPLEGTRSGSIFEDRFDPGLRWYVPTVSLAPMPDAEFSFAATRLGVGSGGDPFDTVTLTLGLSVSEPPDVTAARTANAALAFKPVSTVDQLDATLSVSSVAADGTTTQSTYPMSVTVLDTGASSGATSTEPAKASATLQGPAVIVLFENLRATGSATITITQTYGVWREVRTVPWRFPHPFPGRIPAPVDERVPERAPQVVEAVPAATPLVALAGVRRSVSDLAEVGTVPERLPPVDLPPTTTSYVQVDDTDTSVLALGSAFTTDTFRPRYTLTDGDTTRPIVDVNDLQDFQVVRSEFRELTSLGPVSARYPSIRSLYLGQVSGTVIVLPAQYAIVRGSTGCAARCQAVVDDSPTTLSGCRFELTFTMVANIDPADLAQLTTDLASTPEAQSFQLHVALPSGLDTRTAPTFAGISATTPTVVDGVAGAMVVGIALTDQGPTPAITNVNLLLHALSATSAPVTGEIAVRLDDAYPSAVTTSMVLSLRTTTGTDDLSVTIGQPDASHLSVTNTGPLDEHLTALTGIGGGAPAREDLDVVLVSGANATVELPSGQPNGIVHSQLVVPDPMPAGQIFSFVPLDLQTVSQLQHPLGFNATAIDFSASGLTQIDLQPALTGLPDLSVSALTLTPQHRVDSVNVAVPIAAALAGLDATVALTITHSDGTTTQAEVTHDFLDDPILILTSAQLA